MTTSAMRKIVASVLGAILALTGVLITPAAWAAGPTVTVIPVGREGGDITISGKGFSTTGFGVYVAVALASVTEFYGNSDKFYGYDPSKDTTESPSTIWVYTPSQKAIGSRFAQGRPMNNDGSFTITMKAPPFEQGKDFVVLTTKAHGVGKTDHSDDTRTPVTYREATPAPTGPKTPIAPSKQPSKQAAPSKQAKPSKQAGPNKQSTTPQKKTVEHRSQTPAAHRTMTKQVCTIGASKVTSGSLTWGIRTSFTSYLRGPIANGSWKLSGGANWNGSAFTFPLTSGSFDPATKSGSLKYSGSVHMTGHHGILDMTLAEPSLQIKGSTGHLYLDVKSSSMDGKKTNYGRVDFATFGVSVSGNAAIKGSPVKLTATGAKAFAGFYRAGEPMNPLSTNLTLSAEKVCHNVTVDAVTGKVIGDDSGKGAGRGLPVTGAEGPSSDEIDLGIVGGLALTAVVSTVVVCRRYAARI
jgi:hypothetical protein